MNLAEALDAALPELPARQAKGYPRPNPKMIWSENIEDGKPIIAVYVPGTLAFFRLEPAQWKLVTLFDGQRSYEEIAQLFYQETGIEWTAKDVREFSDTLDAVDFWYKTPLEKNVALTQKLSESRAKKVKPKSKFDVAHMQFSGWNPDDFITWTYSKLKFVYTGWFTILTLCLFGFTGYVFVDRWSEIGRDTLLYYNFTKKSLWDLAGFWTLFLVMGFIHESAHALTCKHYGGRVPKMGLQFIYLTPAFYVDVTESYVYGSRWQRAAVILAGVWVETIVCGFATIVWWGTSPGSLAHEFAYKVILITGVAVIVVNMNPLIRLDGYYIFSEIIGFADVKERSTAYVSNLVKKYVWGLPVEVEYVAPRRRWLYIPYALLSGAYSYFLLYAVARFARNVLANYSPDWAFIPATALGLLIFKGRIKTLWRFMGSVWLDKKERVMKWFHGPRLIAVSVLAALVLFVPIWPRTVTTRFEMEPINRVVLRAQVPGAIEDVYASEGQRVPAGAPLIRMSDLELESMAAKASADRSSAGMNLRDAQLRYAGFGQAIALERQTAAVNRTLKNQAEKLNVISPLSGTVMTPRLENLAGSYVKEGTLLVEIADTDQMRVRIFVPEYEVRYVHSSAPVSLKFDAFTSTYDTQVSKLYPAPDEISPGLLLKENYRGVGEPRYYIAESVMTNPGTFRVGMIGTAKIFVDRRSLAGIFGRDVWDFASRKIW